MFLPHPLQCHLGILGGGHYIAFAQGDDKHWYLFNDSACKPVSFVCVCVCWGERVRLQFARLCVSLSVSSLWLDTEQPPVFFLFPLVSVVVSSVLKRIDHNGYSQLPRNRKIRLLQLHILG